MGLGTYRNAVVACAVAALVVLAGCNAGPGGGGESAAYTTSGEELNGTKLQSDHVGQLESAGSFTTVVDLRLESGDRDARFEQTTAVNRTGDRARQSSRISAGGTVGELRSDSYTDGNVTYERLAFGTGDSATVRYRRGGTDDGSLGGVQPVNLSSATNANLAKEVAESINWTQTGVVDRDGETLTRYEATGRENFTDFRDDTDLGSLEGLGANASEATIDSVNATLLVSPDGLVREFRFRLTGTTDGKSIVMQFAVRTTDVGATDATPPDWLDEARAQTSG